MTDYQSKYNEYLELINEALKTYAAKEDCLQDEIYLAVNYSLMAGGKRIRPVILLEFCNICGGSIVSALPVACALEMIHTYSLIHDDLPCMDDDDLRRGKPTNHIVFGEAGAVLAGDALLNLAFETIVNFAASSGLSNEQIIKILQYLSTASGIKGMIGGQVIDMRFEKTAADIESLRSMHRLKTGAMFKASAVLGCICANASEDKIKSAENFADNFGLAFQITDDILDVVGSAEKTGKNKSDVNNNKSTFVSLLGMENAKKEAEKYINNAKEELMHFNNNDFIIWLANTLLEREK